MVCVCGGGGQLQGKMFEVGLWEIINESLLKQILKGGEGRNCSYGEVVNFLKESPPMPPSP